MNRSHTSTPELLVRKAGRREEGNVLGWRNMEQQTSNYCISEREQEDDRSSDDMEKDNTERRSSVDKETEQNYLELTGREMEPAHLLERKTEEAVELNLKATTPARRTEKYQRPSEEQQWMEGRQHQRLGQEQLSYGLDSFPRFGEGERWQHRWDMQDWTRQRGKLSTKQLESELGSDQHRSSAERELLKLMSQDKRRAEQEDIEFKMMSPLTQNDTLPGKAAYHRRRISGFQSVMPTRLLFNDTVEWDNWTAQLEGRRRILSPPQMSAVDESDSGDGWEERWSPLPTAIQKEAVDCRDTFQSNITSSASARARVVTRNDRGRHENAERTNSHSDDDREAAYGGSREEPDSTDSRRRRRTGLEKQSAADEDFSEGRAPAWNCSRNAPTKPPYPANETCATSSGPSGEANQSQISLRKYYLEKSRVHERNEAAAG